MSNTMIEEVAAIFLETQKAHHEAFIEADGYDPQWPAWYAVHVQKKLGNILKIEFTIEELTQQIDTVQREHAALEPKLKDWHKYYAQFFISQYTSK